MPTTPSTKEASSSFGAPDFYFQSFGSYFDATFAAAQNLGSSEAFKAALETGGEAFGRTFLGGGVVLGFAEEGTYGAFKGLVSSYAAIEGAEIGSGIGAAIAGPPGAVIGAVAGGFAGAVGGAYGFDFFKNPEGESAPGGESAAAGGGGEGAPTTSPPSGAEAPPAALQSPVSAQGGDGADTAGSNGQEPSSFDPASYGLGRNLGPTNDENGNPILNVTSADTVNAADGNTYTIGAESTFGSPSAPNVQEPSSGVSGSDVPGLGATDGPALGNSASPTFTQLNDFKGDASNLVGGSSQPTVDAPNQSGGSVDNSAYGNPQGQANALPNAVASGGQGDGSASSNVVDTSGAAGDYTDAYGNTYSSQSAADQGQDQLQDGGDNSSGDYGSGGNDQYAGGYGGGDGGYSGGSYGGGSFGGGSYGGGSFGGGSFGPVVLDLTGKGINITPKSASNTFFDMAGDGYQHHTAWAGAGDGVLVLDTQGNGQITQQNQVVFTDWDPSAQTDMQALLDVFDTNHNGQLDSGDAQFSSFKIMVTNADGTTTLETLAQAGVASINLKQDKTAQVYTDGSRIDGETTYTKTAGGTGTAATVSFAYDAADYALKSTTTKNGDGSTTIDNKQLAADGSLASETMSTTAANGLTRTTKYDANGDGVFEDVQTDATVNNGDGTRTETLSDTNAAGVLLDRATTTTSADGTTVSIMRDTDGNGIAEQKEVDATAADGSKSVTLSDLDPNGSTRDSVMHAVSTDGQTGTTKHDYDGDGTYDLTTVDATVTAGDGSRTQTVSDTNADGSLRDKTITATAANAATQTIQVDANGDGVVDTTRSVTISRNADNSTTTVQTDKNNDGSTRDSATTKISANGLVTTTQSDPDGNGSFDATRTDTTVINADTSRTETIADTNVKGTLVDKTVIAKGADGITRTTSVDADGNGKNDMVDAITVSSGAVTETVSNYQSDGATLVSRSTTSTSADGLTRVVSVDYDGDGKTDLATTYQTIKNANGSGQQNQAIRSNSGALLELFTTTTSADGLTTSTTEDLTGDGTPEYGIASTTVVNADGSRTTTTKKTSTNGTLLSNIVTTISADRNTTSVTSDANGDGKTDRVETIARQPDGSTIDKLDTYAPAGGSPITEAVTTTSATGLSVATTNDYNDDGAIDFKTVEATVLNSDGSRTTTQSVFDKGTTLRRKSITTVSATGLTTTTQSDVDGNGSIDATTTSTTTLNKDGSRTTIAKQTTGNTSVATTTTTVSATGLSTTISADLDGNGSTDKTTNDVTTLNADGTRTETVSDKSNSGALIDQTVTTLSADRRTTTIARNIDGVGGADNTETIALQASNATLDTTSAVNASGTLIYKLARTTAANGLSYNQTLDSNGDGTTDETQSDAITFGTDGSRTETYSDANASANIPPGSSGEQVKIITKTSYNGLSKTITVTGSNEGANLAHTTTDVTAIATDGSQTETRTVTTTSGSTTYTVSKELISDDAHHLTHSVQLDEYGSGTYNVSDVTTLNADGSTTETYTDMEGGALYEKDVTTTSANGRTITVQSDLDGDGKVDQTKSTTFANDGSRVDAYTTYNTSGATTSSATTTTSADGRTVTTAYDYDGDGTTDATVVEVSVVGSDGHTTERRSDYTASGTLRDQLITNTAANGYSTTTSIDLNGDGTVDETQSNTITLNADGTKTATVQSNYADGSLKSKTVTTTSANGLVSTSNEDLNGDGKTDVTRVDTTLSSGARTIVTSYLNAAGTLLSRDTATISADGRQQQVSRDFNGDGKQDVLEIEEHSADGDGSYDVAAEDANSALYDGNHNIDENGVDQINIIPTAGGKTGTPIYGTETLQQEAVDLGNVDRLYDVMLDRDPTTAERQGYQQYSDYDDEVNAVLASTEFTKKYGSAQTSAQFVEQMYQNAYGRSAKVSELNAWVSQLKAGTATKAGLVETLTDSAEHLAYGDTHAVTNNTQVVSGNFTLDHTTDKLVAANTVDRLYLTSLARHADSSGSSQNSTAILNGTVTESQIAASLIGSAEFKSDYGTPSDGQFVTQMFQNGLHRAPTSSELTSWTQLLGAGTISRADFVVGIADSPDQLAVANGSSGTKTAVKTASLQSQSAPAQSSSTTSHADTAASINRMVQAMAAMSPMTGAFQSGLSGSHGASEHQLAAAHH